MRSILARLGASLSIAACAASTTFAQRPVTPAERDTATSRLGRITRDMPGVHLATDDIVYGSRVIGANDRITGDVVIFHGTLDIAGTIEGDAVALDGRVILRNGAHITGDVIAVGGGIRNDGATVGGESHALGGLVGVREMRSPFARIQGPRGRGALLAGWFVVIAMVGVAVAFLARSNLEQIAERVEEDFWKALMFGAVGQLAIVPGIVVVTIALALTIIGVLAIPFAIVGIILAAAGALALGFVTMAYVTGAAFLTRRSGGSAGGQTAVLLLVGLTVYTLMWAIAGVPSWGGAMGSLIRAAAVLVTWAAVTVGFGATILARGGTRGAFTAAIPLPASMDEDLSWQTPTPVTGVTAARRPSAAPGADR